MRYCLRYTRKTEHLFSDEIIVRYSEKYSLEDLKNFIARHLSQRIILDVREYRPDFTIPSTVTVMLSYEDRDYIPTLYEDCVKYFFAEIADSWDILTSMINLGVSDVRIGNELGFDMERVSAYCNKKNVNVRVFCNICQTNAMLPVDTFTSFFIRPEGIHCYENLVDTCEFFCNIEREAAIYKIYKDEIWHGKLKEIILSLDSDVRSDAIPTVFDVTRINCGKACLRDRCKVCENILSLAKTLDDNGIRFTEKKLKK